MSQHFFCNIVNSYFFLLGHVYIFTTILKLCLCSFFSLLIYDNNTSLILSYVTDVFLLESLVFLLCFLLCLLLDSLGYSVTVFLFISSCPNVLRRCWLQSWSILPDLIQSYVSLFIRSHFWPLRVIEFIYQVESHTTGFSLCTLWRRGANIYNKVLTWGKQEDRWDLLLQGSFLCFVVYWLQIYSQLETPAIQAHQNLCVNPSLHLYSLLTQPFLIHGLCEITEALWVKIVPFIIH